MFHTDGSISLRNAEQILWGFLPFPKILHIHELLDWHFHWHLILLLLSYKKKTDNICLIDGNLFPVI